jgi:hypothetical protein
MSAELAVRVPNTTDLATEQRKAEDLAIALRGATCESADEYSALDTILSEVARKKAAVLEMRKGYTAPLYGVIKRVEGDFRPLVSSLETCEAALKGAMGAYRVACERAEREARELAAKAAESGDAGALVEALTVASEAGAKPDARATTTFFWRVKVCNPAAMSREFLVPDLPRLEKLARAHKGDAPPIVPGVTFERIAQIGAKK